MKRTYEMPEISVILVNDEEDIITLSGRENGNGESEDLMEMFSNN